jgi:Flp pilus assembly protein TadD
MAAGKSLLLPPDLGIRLEHLGREFLAEFLSRATARHPDNVEALAELATTLTALGRLEEGLATDRRLVELRPKNPTVHYNLACSLALLSRRDPALEALERAIQLGFDDQELLRSDEDLASLRADPRFVALVQRLGETA